MTFKNMKLATKISMGFGLLIVLMVALGGMALYSMNDAVRHSRDISDKHVPGTSNMVMAESAAQTGMFNIRGYLMSEEGRYLKDGLKYLAEAKKHIADAKKVIDTYPDLAAIGKEVDKCGELLAAYETLVRQTADSREKMLVVKKKMAEIAGQFTIRCKYYIADQKRKTKTALSSKDGTEAAQVLIFKRNAMRKILDFNHELRIKNFSAIVAGDPKLIRESLQEFTQIFNSIDGILAQTKDDGEVKLLEQAKAAARGYHADLIEFIGAWDKVLELTGKVVKTRKALLAQIKKVTLPGLQELGRLANNNVEELNTSSTIMLAGLAAAAVLGILLALTITISITRPLNKLIAGLSEGAAQVTTASTQVSASSQTLAQGAAEQAASLEETSASLEEMASMTHKNAENARQADHLMKDSKTVVDQANNSMTELIAAMGKITSASEETSKIIKTIDEIAFQTNLLALNAAVEAARAGEAGAGFAVVADEVRNLAMRAAEAARNTSELIEGNIKNISQGSSLVQQTGDAFGQVIESSAKTAELVSEIAAASHEQSQGITQVNHAMTEMDKVTQQNAASAEESAAASEELSAQATTMDGFVDDLGRLVGGAANGRGNAPKTLPAISSGKKGMGRALPLPVSKIAQKADPRKEIPMEDDDFRDF